jgi:hypothetical protein
MKHDRPGYASLSRLGPSLLLALSLNTAPATAGEDSRLPYSATSPDWLRAVGSLRVPGVKIRDGYRQHHQEDCSATLVVSDSGDKADTIITAWHCLEFYRDLSYPIMFTLLKDSGEPLVMEAQRLADGGGMEADWAVLRLEQAVPMTLARALTVHSGRADASRSIVMAGYSRDGGLGSAGEQLTYDPSCSITHQGIKASDSDCIAFQGASGGAVVQLSGNGQPTLAGVISRGDSEGLSIFVPVKGFRSTLQRFLR